MDSGGFPTSLMLESVGSANVEPSELIAKHRVRHELVFRTCSLHGVVDFPLQGSPISFQGLRLYFTRVKLGNPPQEYHVLNLLIDHGSDITWINCNPCAGCPLPAES